MTMAIEHIVVDVAGKKKNSMEHGSFPRTDFSLRIYGTSGLLYLFIALITSVMQMFPLCKFYISENDWLVHLTLIAFAVAYIFLFIGKENKCLQPFLIILVMLLQALATAGFVTLNNSFGVLHSIGLTAFILLMIFFLACLLQRCCSISRIIMMSIFFALPDAVLLQVFLGCDMTELFVSFFMCATLVLYHIYFTHVVVKKFLHWDFRGVLVYLYLWPVIFASSKVQ